MLAKTRMVGCFTLSVLFKKWVRLKIYWSMPIYLYRCASDSTVQFHSVATANKIRFSFTSFKFFMHTQVYLRCQVLICLNGSSDSRCSSACTGNNINRFRRSALLESEEEIRLRSLEKRDALKIYSLGIGPFIESEQGYKRKYFCSLVTRDPCCIWVMVVKYCNDASV